MNEKVLSIIVPVYKVERFVERCVKSILSQMKDSSVELIIVDDGSPDNSINIVRQNINGVDNVQLVSQKNQGLSVARNNGLALAKGKFIWFIDSDDWIEQGAIKNLLHSIKKNEDAEAFLVKIQNYNENEEEIGTHSFPTINNFGPISGVDLFWEKGFSSSPIQEYVIKRSIFSENKLEFTPGIFHEDMDIAPKLLFSINRLYTVEDVVYCYLIRNSGSIVTTPNYKRCEDLLYISKKYYDLLRKEPSTKRRSIIQFTIGSTLNYAINQAIEGNNSLLIKKDLAKIPYRRMAFCAIGSTPSFKRKMKLFLIAGCTSLAMVIH